MIIPNKIKFLGHIVTVEQVDKIDDNVDGQYDWDKMEILIKKKNHQTYKEAVLFHEISEMLIAYLAIGYQEAITHQGFSKYSDLLWAILNENDLLK